MIQIAVVNQQNQVIYSTISEEISLETIVKDGTVICPIKNVNRRQAKVKIEGWEIVVISYDPKITNKIFRHYLDSLKMIAPIIFKTSEEIVEKESKKTRRLKHNIISYTTKIQQELFKLIPQETVARGARNQLELIEEIISKNLKNTAHAYLKILKNVNFLRAEFAAYEMLSNETGRHKLDVQSHSLYKVIHLSLSSFWLDFIEKGVLIRIENSTKLLHFDYNSVTVSFSHIFDNAVKYVSPNSEIHISFKEENERFFMNISMISLKIDPAELHKIFNEEYSGILANTLHLNGSGIGMNIIQKLLKMNDIEILLKINTNASLNKMIGTTPYEKNEIELIFPNE